jgi:hypothetical protein
MNKPPYDSEFAALMKQLGLLSRQAQTLNQLRTQALTSVMPYINTQGEPTGTAWRYFIDGFVDTEKDEYWEIDDWIRSTEFVQWILKEHKEHISDQLDKDCVWELLHEPKQLPSNELPLLKDSINKHYKLK